MPRLAKGKFSEAVYIPLRAFFSYLCAFVPNTALPAGICGWGYLSFSISQYPVFDGPFHLILYEERRLSISRRTVL